MGVFDKIVTVLNTISLKDLQGYREKLSLLNAYADEIAVLKPAVEEFETFLRTIHNSLVQADTSTRSILLRLIRISLISKFHIDALVTAEIHWIVTSSLEREHEFVQERMQALKLIRQCIELHPENFPIAYARSLVAVASNKDDNIRRVCLETLRELCVVNPEIAVQASGVSSLLDAIIEPSTQDMADSILMSLIFLLNDPKSRRFLRPTLDVRQLLSPLTDLDCETADIALRWKSAKRALVLMMRTWAGVILLTSDSLGLPTLVGMLKDSKVSAAAQEVIIDSFAEIFEPIFSKAKKKRFQSTSSLVGSMGIDFSVPTPGETTVGFDEGRSGSGSDKSRASHSFSLMSTFTRVTSSASSNSTFSPAGKRRPSSTQGASSFGGGPDDKSGSRPPSESSSYPLRSDPEFDPIYNLMDNYASLICGAFIHCGILESLCYLGTRSEAELAKKARYLLLSILRVIARIFPENFCSELLTMPALVELATKNGTWTATNAAHRSSQILMSFADAFSVTPTAAVHLEGEGVSSQRNRAQTITQSVAGTGKFYPTCNVKSIRDLSLELKASSNSKHALQFSTLAVSSRLSMLDDLHSKLQISIDRSEFRKQMDSSRVIGKEGKEPFRWDWNVIGDMLKYSFEDSDRLAEALETKWVRRVSGFYRCSLDEKGYFANLDWEPANLFYLECACDLYHILVNDEIGVSFIGSDRRGMLFNEISRELEQLISSNEKGWVGNLGPKNVFRFTSCCHSMVREFFTLFGRMCATRQGRKLLDSTQVFVHLSLLGSCKSLDYLSRLVVTGLAFTDKGFLSRNLIQIWTTTGNCSNSLRQYIHNLLLILLRSDPGEFLRWGVNIVVNQLLLEETPCENIVKVLEEAIQDPVILQAVCAKGPNLVSIPSTSRIPVRLLAVSDGIKFMASKNLLSPLIEKMLTGGGLEEYSATIENSFSRAMSKTGREESHLQPIVIPVVDKAGTRNSEYGRDSGNLEGITGNGLFGGEAVDLEGLMRIPWNIEVKLTSQAGYSSAGQARDEFLRVDSYLDVSDLPSPATASSISDSTRIIKVRGIILDGRGLPTGHPVAANRIIQNCLLAGVCPVNRSGGIGSVFSEREARAMRRKSTSTSASSQGSRESFSQPRGGNRASNVGASDLVLEEVPLTFQLEHLQDWSICKPTNRQSNVIKLRDGKFAVEVSGEPVRWIFSKGMPGSNQRLENVIIEDSSPGSEGSNRLDTSRTGGFMYLTEVQYVLRLETGLPVFVAIPRHPYGELGKSLEGCNFLTERGVVEGLASCARNESISSTLRRAAFWGLGHLGSSDMGCSLLHHVDPTFIDWATHFSCTASNFSLRGAAFYSLGLISRSKRGLRKLSYLQWDASPFGSTSAVAFPRHLAQMFSAENIKFSSVESPESIDQDINLKPFGSHLSGEITAEQDVLNLIAKMPGVIIFSECKARLELIRSQNPELFKSRDLFVAVQRLLEAYTFKLTVRREIGNLFHAEAKLK